MMSLSAAIFMCAGSSISAFCADRQKNDAKDKARISEVDSLLKAQYYRITVDKAFPTAGKMINLTTPYYVEVKTDTVDSHLPYFGRAYSIPYGGGDGLNFEESLSDYSMTKGKKERNEIKFSVRTSEDTFDFNITVYPEGEAYVSIISNNRQPISYTGELTVPDDGKEKKL